jgi:hypothetical protein
MLVTNDFKGCPNKNFIHDKLVHIRKSCFAIAKGRDCTKEGCKWAHDNINVRRDIAGLRKLTAARYQALERAVAARAKKANPKRAAKRERQAAKRKADREQVERKAKIAR